MQPNEPLPYPLHVSDEKIQSRESRDIYPSKEGVIYIPSHDPGAGLVQKKIDVELLVNLANTLTKADRKNLLTRLALDQQTSPAGADRDMEMWVQAVHASLTASVGAGDGGVGGIIPLKRLLSTTSNWEFVDGFMQRTRFATLTVTQRQAAYNMLARLLVEHSHETAKAVHAPLTPKFVANRLPFLASIFDAAFPGYLAAGLAHLVASRFTQGDHHAQD